MHTKYRPCGPPRNAAASLGRWGGHCQQGQQRQEVDANALFPPKVQCKLTSTTAFSFAETHLFAALILAKGVFSPWHRPCRELEVRWEAARQFLILGAARYDLTRGIEWSRCSNRSDYKKTQSGDLAMKKFLN